MQLWFAASGRTRTLEHVQGETFTMLNSKLHTLEQKLSDVKYTPEREVEYYACFNCHIPNILSDGIVYTLPENWEDMRKGEKCYLCDDCEAEYISEHYNEVSTRC